MTRATAKGSPHLHFGLHVLLPFGQSLLHSSVFLALLYQIVVHLGDRLAAGRESTCRGIWLVQVLRLNVLIEIRGFDLSGCCCRLGFGRCSRNRIAEGETLQSTGSQIPLACECSDRILNLFASMARARSPTRSIMLCRSQNSAASSRGSESRLISMCVSPSSVCTCSKNSGERRTQPLQTQKYR